MVMLTNIKDKQIHSSGPTQRQRATRTVLHICPLSPQVTRTRINLTEKVIVFTSLSYHEETEHGNISEDLEMFEVASTVFYISLINTSIYCTVQLMRTESRCFYSKNEDAYLSSGRRRSI